MGTVLSTSPPGHPGLPAATCIDDLRKSRGLHSVSADVAQSRHALLGYSKNAGKMDGQILVKEAEKAIRNAGQALFVGYRQL